jgi:hypothetical protein
MCDNSITMTYYNVGCYYNRTSWWTFEEQVFTSIEFHFEEIIVLDKSLETGYLIASISWSVVESCVNRWWCGQKKKKMC